MEKKSAIILEEGSRDQFLAFQFDLPKSSLILIDDSLVPLHEYIHDQKAISTIGIDTECPPFAHKKKTSLVQLAIRKQSGHEAVFLLDYIKLSSSKERMLQLDELLQPLLSSTTIIKVGQGLRQDFSQLCSSYPESICYRSVYGVLETNALHQVLAPTITYPISLRNLTRNYLHFDLDKSNQLSDWKARPMTESQIMYAACDALVLLRLYDVMLFEAKLGCPDFQLSEILTLYTHGQSPKRSPKRSRSSEGLGLPITASTGSLVESICSSATGNASSVEHEMNQVQGEEAVPNYQKFYSFAERYWYQNELKTQSHGTYPRVASPRDIGMPLPKFEGKRTRFDADGEEIPLSPDAIASLPQNLVPESVVDVTRDQSVHTSIAATNGANNLDNSDVQEYDVGVNSEDILDLQSSSSSSSTSSSSKSDSESLGSDDNDDDDNDDSNGPCISISTSNNNSQSNQNQPATVNSHQNKSSNYNNKSHSNGTHSQLQGNIELVQVAHIDSLIQDNLHPEILRNPRSYPNIEADIIEQNLNPLEEFLNSSAMLSAYLAVFVLELHFVTVAAHLWQGLSLSDAMVSYAFTLLFVTTLLLIVDSMAQYVFHRRRFDHRCFLRSCHLHLCSTYSL